MQWNAKKKKFHGDFFYNLFFELKWPEGSQWSLINQYLLYVVCPGVIPSPVHLVDVQRCLSQIQQILVQLQKFWENVGSLLDGLKDNTFVNELLIDYLDDLKQQFVTSIEAAEKVT